MNDNRILATYVTYKMLYNNKKTDVYDIISEFIRYIIVNERKHSFSQFEITQYISEYYDFQIPSLVIKPAMKRIDGVSLENQKYIIDYSKIKSNEDFLKLQTEAVANNNLILKDLESYIKLRLKRDITEEDINSIHESFRKYILDESINGEYDEYISAFIIEKSSDNIYMNKINQIREGHILYEGLSFNQNISSYGWQGKVVLYLDTEILFYIAGYNGSTFETIANEFLKLISDANAKEKCISLRYFNETKKIIDIYFDTAEKIFTEGRIIRPGETAMESIINGCNSEIDIRIKKEKFYYLLKKCGINEEKKDDFYCTKYEKANLESIKYMDDEKQNNIRLISHINKLREDKVFYDYAEAKAIFISETGNMLELSKEITKEKELKQIELSGNKTQHIIPFAVTLFTITNMLWYRLNNSLHRKEEPSTIDAVVRAQIVLSKYINDSVSKSYDEMIKQEKNCDIDKEEMASIIIGMRRYSCKPENVLVDSINDALNFICEKDINKFREDFERQKHSHDALKLEHDETKKELENTQARVDYLERKAIQDDLEKEYIRKNTQLENQKEWLAKAQQEFDYQEKERKKRRKRKIILVVGLYIALALGVVCSILYFGWDVMEPITYIIGFVSTAYLSISKFFDINWGIDKFINSYERNVKYVQIKDDLENCIDKVNKLNSEIVEIKQNNIAS